jgi:hypothetical protein
MKVIKRFQDKFTKKVHAIGDSYEHKDADRVAFLVEKGFLQEGEGPKEPQEPGSEFPKHSGGAWFELSNGEKVQGKEEAAAAQKELDEKEGE